MTLVPKKAFAEGKLARSRENIIGSTSRHRVVHGSLPVPTALDSPCGCRAISMAYTLLHPKWVVLLSNLV